MRRNLRKEQGITIIALIITIIILLILVGVSINLAIKGNLFGSTQKAVNGTNAKVEEEQTRVDELMGNLAETVMNTCEHSIAIWTSSGEETHTATCQKCGKVFTENHSLPSTWTGNADGTHTATCSKCEKIITEEHTFKDGICTKCGLIVFYIDVYGNKKTYTAINEMTWAEWCESDYQPDVIYEQVTPPFRYKEFKVDSYILVAAPVMGTNVHYSNEVSLDGTHANAVLPTSKITPGGNYKVYVLCLAWDTEISVVYEDEKGKRRIKKKKIQDLKPGDEILSFDWETMKLVPNKVKYVDGEENKTHYELDKWTFDDGTVIETVHRHEFYNVESKRFKYMDEWKIGEHAYKQDGTKPMLVAHEVISKVVKHCTIVGEKGTNYFANDLLSGDRTCPKDIEL